MQYKNKGPKALREEFEKKQELEREQLEALKQEDQSDDGDQKKNNAESDCASSIGEKEDPSAWQNE